MKLYLDIETASLVGSMDDLLLIGCAVDDGPVHVIDVTYPEPDLFMVRRLLADPTVTKVSHTYFDERFLAEAGFQVAGDIVDTKVMAWVLNENTPLDLDWLTWRYAQVEMDKRLRRSGGHVYFEADDGVRHDLAEWQTWHDTDAWQQFQDYNRRDVAALRTLEQELLTRLDEAEWTDYWLDEEVPYTRVLFDMERRGLPIDLEATAQLEAEVAVEHDQLKAELLDEGGLPESFNLNSQPQLVAYLFSRVCTLNDVLVYDVETVQCLKSCLDGEHEDCDFAEGIDYFNCVVDFLPEGFTLDKLGRDRVHGHWTVKGRGLRATPPPVNKVTGEVGKLPSTSSPELLYAHASDPWVHKLCTEYRKTEKLLTTYLRKFPAIARGGRIYGHYNQTGTVTGRLSSFDPNMQNMPARGDRGKKVRSLFVGNFVIADYDQLEMRIMASLSGDHRLVQVFQNGQDPHEMLASAIFGDVDVLEVPRGAACSYRDAAKTLNYAMGYGAGRRKVAQTLSLLGWPTSVDVAGGYLDEMERFYHTLFEWKGQLIAEAHNKGHVSTLGGRRRRLRLAFKDTANWKLVGYGERQAVNAVVQGTAADIIRRAMVQLDTAIPWVPMLAQVHDELVFEYDPDTFIAPVDLGVIQSIGEKGHGFDLAVPLVFEPAVATSWADKGGSAVHEALEEVADVGDGSGVG